MSIQDSISDNGTLPTSSTTTSNPYLPGTTLHISVDRTFAPSTVLGDQPLNATPAYDRLINLQGECIPKMLAHLHLSPEPSSDLGEKSEEKYFRVNGVMLESISGFPLSQIGIHPHSPNPEQWESILQRVVDNAEKINRSGVVMSDCRPENVFVETSSWKPFVHDFAQASVGDIEDMEEGFGLSAHQYDNPRGLVWALAARIEKEKGLIMRLRYFDYTTLIQGIEAI